MFTPVRVKVPLPTLMVCLATGMATDAAAFNAVGAWTDCPAEEEESVPPSNAMLITAARAEPTLTARVGRHPVRGVYDIWIDLIGLGGFCVNSESMSLCPF